MRYRYRCHRRIPGKGLDQSGHRNHCGGRRTLTRMIEFYVRRPHCPNCGADSLTLDRHRMAREVGRGAPTCRCDGYPFPHREGSKWCRSYQGTYTEEDMRDYYYQTPGAC